MAQPKHIKNVPGRKTDVKDAEWIADERNKPKVISRMKQRIEQLGYRVTIEPVPVAAPG